MTIKSLLFLIAALMLSSSLEAGEPQASVTTPSPALDDQARHAQWDEMQKEEMRWERQRAHLVDLIFPRSQSWTRFEDLPLAFSGEQGETKAKALIRQMGSEAQDNGFNVMPFFRQINLGNHLGIIYSGPALIAGKYTTRIWLNYFSDSGAEWQDLGIPGKVVRVKQGEEPRFTGIVQGCCADTGESFYRGDLLNSDGLEIIRSSMMLKIPDSAKDARFTASLTSNDGLTMRFSPALNDEPSPDPDAPLPAIGNVARRLRYLDSTDVLMTFRDSDQKPWILVKTTLFDDVRMTYHDPGYPPVDLGWIEASTIIQVPLNQPLLEWIAAH